jgi:hypothetical protein
MAPKQYVLSGGNKKWRQHNKVMDQDRISDKDKIWQRKGQRKEGKDNTREEHEQAGEDRDFYGFLWNMQHPQKFNIKFCNGSLFILSQIIFLHYVLDLSLYVQQSGELNIL